MPPIAPNVVVTRRSALLRTSDYSTLCWSCLIKQRRQFSQSFQQPPLIGNTARANASPCTPAVASTPGSQGLLPIVDASSSEALASPSPPAEATQLRSRGADRPRLETPGKAIGGYDNTKDGSRSQRPSSAAKRSAPKVRHFTVGKDVATPARLKSSGHGIDHLSIHKRMMEEERRTFTSLVEQHRRQAQEHQRTIGRLSLTDFDKHPQETLSGTWWNTKIVRPREVVSRDLLVMKTIRPQTELPGTMRSFHSSHNFRQEVAASQPATGNFSDFVPNLGRDITARQYLSRWQELYGRPNQEMLDELGIVGFNEENGPNLTRLMSSDDIRSVGAREDDVQEVETQRHAAELVDDPTNGKFLNPGDLVEISFPSLEREPLLAVFIRQFETQSQFYSLNGKWFHRKLNDVQFSVPGYISQSLVDTIVPYLPSTEVTEDLIDKMQMMDVSAPRELASPIIRKLLDFAEQADAAYRKHASLLDRAHTILSHDTDLRFGTLQKITETLLRVKDPSVTLMYAVRKALVHQPLGFITDARSHRMTSVFQIMPATLVSRLEQAREWIREYQEDVARRSGARDGSAADQKRSKPLKELKGATIVRNFASKARKLVEESRRMRETTRSGRVGSSKVRREITPDSSAIRSIDSIKFSEEDAILIRFLEAWTVSAIFRDIPRIQSLPPILLRAVGVYDESWQCDSALGFTFLQEIGVIPPHENRVKFDPHLLLPTAQHSRPLEQLNFRLAQMGTSKRNEPSFKDYMQDLRKDWGDLPVFCIDSASAQEIDDGVSLEKIPGSQEYWVHVHVANPTAFVHKMHLVAKMAAHLTETIYMPERTYPMIPNWLTQRKFSLAPDRPCLTFSTRLNMNADILDIKIQPGFIRNVLSLTPSTVQSIVEEGSSEKSTPSDVLTLTVGGKVPSIPTKKVLKQGELLEDEKSDLRILQALALARQKKRTQAGGMFWDMNYPEVSVFAEHDRPGLPWSHPSRDQARFTEGDPIIHMQAVSTMTPFLVAGRQSDVLVREMMMLAGEVGAKWCRDRDIPIIYRGTIARPGSMTAEEYQEKVINPSIRPDGTLPFKVAMQNLTSLGVSVASTTPYEHRILGTPQYAKLTSPLRRYGDMLLHWQIESALRAEAEKGRKLVAADRDNYTLAFAEKEVQTIVARLAPRERLISRTKRNAQAFWLTQLFFRAFYYNEAELPETLEVFISSIPKDGFGRVVGLALKYTFDLDITTPGFAELGEEPQLGDLWEVRITHVDCYHRRVETAPVRLIRREDV